MKLDSATTFANGRFLVERELGQGGTGIVYEALDTERDMRVALKTLLHVNTDNLYYFKQEFRALHDLIHPNLCSLMELIEEKGVWFFTMELIQGMDFLSYIGPSKTGQSLPPSVFQNPIDPCRVMIPKQVIPEKNVIHSTGFSVFDETRLRKSLVGLCEGLKTLHASGKIHRDIKPSNVMVTEEGRVVILDFGMVADMDISGQTDLDFIVGTAEYMAPEQVGAQLVGPEADWYSVGVLLYEALTGNLPFAGPPMQVLMDKQTSDPIRPSATNSNLPHDLDMLCMDLLSRNPKTRPTAFDILEILSTDKSSSTYFLRSDTSRLTPDAVFVGRHSELQLLKEAYQNTADGAFESVVIEGVSGVGKSALIQNFTSDLASSAANFVMLTSRCYERESAPYKAFDGIIESLISHIKSLPLEEAARLLPENWHILVLMFPALKRSDVFATISSPPIEIADPHEIRKRAFNAFRDVLSLITKNHPLVMIIDDMQWVDSDSILLLQQLVSDSESPPLLLILLGRYAEDSKDSVLDWKSLVSSNHKRIELQTLDGNDSEELARLFISLQNIGTKVDPSSIATEAGGHPLYIAELIHHIAFGAEEWKSLRLDEVILTRMKTLPWIARQVLETVCVAGTPLTRGHLQKITYLKSEDFYKNLALLRATNLIRSRGPKENHLIEPYHDRVRETVTKHSERNDNADQLHLKIGRFLLAEYETTELDDHIFEVSRHLNEASSLMTDANEIHRLSLLNLQAGNKAKTASAYGSAIDYFLKSLALIQNTASHAIDTENRRENYDLVIELHTKIAETAFLQSDQTLMNTHCRAVIDKAKNILDKATVYETMIQDAQSRSDLKRAVSLSLDVLDQFGVKLPKNPGKLRLMVDLLKTKRLLKGRTREDILNAPLMKDPYKERIAQIAFRAGPSMYFVSRNLMAITILSRLRWSLLYGISPASISAYVSYAMICCGVLRKFEEGYKYGTLSLALVERLNAKQYRGAITFRFNSFVRHWNEPLENSLEPLKEAYRQCIEVGDLEVASFPSFNFALISLFTGRPLQSYLADIDLFVTGLKKFGEQYGRRITLAFRQAADNLISEHPECTKLKGDYFDEDEMTPLYVEESNQTGLFVVFGMKTMLSYLFGNYEEAMENTHRYREHIKGGVSSYLESVFYFHDSLVWLAGWDRLDKKQKNTATKTIRSNLKLLHKFSRSCVENFENKLLLVQAEQARVKGDEVAAVKLYKRSIDRALENGFVNEAAMASELFAKFSVERGDRSSGKQLLDLAIAYYEQWGALAKATQLRDKTVPASTI